MFVQIRYKTDDKSNTEVKCDRTNYGYEFLF